ncbi:MAG: hypothetical protein WDN48_13240 [Pseudolabrys sp.]
MQRDDVLLVFVDGRGAQLLRLRKITGAKCGDGPAEEFLRVIRHFSHRTVSALLNFQAGMAEEEPAIK